MENVRKKRATPTLPSTPRKAVAALSGWASFKEQSSSGNKRAEKREGEREGGHSEHLLPPV